MKKLLALSLMLSSAVWANTQTYQTLPSEKATFELCESAAKAFNTNTMAFGAVADIIKPYWKYGDIDPNRSLAAIGRNSDQIVSIASDLWGKPLNTVFVKTDKDKLGYFLRHNFMVRRENLALDFYCEFYKGEDNWNMISIKWSDNYQNFFDE